MSDTETTTTEAAPSLSLDEALAAAENEARENRPAEDDDPDLDFGSLPRKEAKDAEKPAEKPAAKEAPKGDAPTAKLLKTKAAELTKLEMDLAAKRGELTTSEKVHAEKLASADTFAAFRKALKDDPAAALELIGEDISDFSERLSKAVFGHDAGAKKLTGVEKQLAELQAKIAEREKAETEREAEQKQQREQAARELQAKNNYLDLTAKDPERWPSLQRVEVEELANAAGAFRIRRFERTGKWPSFDETNDELEKEAAKNLAEREAAKPPVKTAARTASRTLVPDAAAERGNGREMTLEEKLAQAERQERERAARDADLVSQLYHLVSQPALRIVSETRTVSPAKGLTRCRKTIRLAPSTSS